MPGVCPGGKGGMPGGMLKFQIDQCIKGSENIQHSNHLKQDKSYLNEVILTSKPFLREYNIHCKV